jgi:hypothetical protein
VRQASWTGSQRERQLKEQKIRKTELRRQSRKDASRRAFGREVLLFQWVQVHLGLSAVVRQSQVARLTVEETSELDLIDPVWQVASLVSEDFRVQVVERVVVDAVGLITEAAILVCKCQLKTINGVSKPTLAYALT